MVICLKIIEQLWMKCHSEKCAVQIFTLAATVAPWQQREIRDILLS